MTDHLPPAQSSTEPSHHPSTEPSPQPSAQRHPEPSPRPAPDLRPLTHRSLLVAASYVVLRRGDHVLLQLRRGTGYMDDHWALVAGHVDPGESVVDAAVREVREEAGVEIAAEALTPLTTLHRLEVGGPQIEQRCDFFYECRTWSGDPVIVEPDRCARMEWFPLDALPDPVVPHELTVLDHLRRGTVPPASLVVRT